MKWRLQLQTLSTTSFTRIGLHSSTVRLIIYQMYEDKMQPLPKALPDVTKTTNINVIFWPDILY